MKKMVLTLAVALGAAAAAPAQQIAGVSFLGQATFATGTRFNDTNVGGLSGITFDAAANTYYSISDDRSQFNPARFYSLNIDLSTGTLANGGVTFTNVTTLRDAAGNPFPALSLDPEGIALTPNGTIFVSSEGDQSAGVNPFVNEFSLVTGQQIRALPVPTKYNVATGSGIRNNLAFESLTLGANGRLVTATENALFQDGPAASLGVGSPSRLLTFNTSGQAGGEFLYLADAVSVPPVPAGAFTTNGLVDLLSLGGDDYLALERSFSTGVGNTIKLYQFSLAGATDISGINSLAAFGLGNVAAVQKELVFDLSELNIPLDNVEGLTFGPTLADGRRSLILVSDNNFSDTQFTQFLAFGVGARQSAEVIPEPGAGALLLPALLLLGAVHARRCRRLRL